MIRDKKGLETVAKLVIVVLSAAILILFVSNVFMQTISESKDRQICYDSIVVKAHTKIGGT